MAKKMSKKEMKAYMPGFSGAKLQKYKKTITNSDVPVPVKVQFSIQIDGNNQICDFQPRSIGGVDLFSRFHNRPAAYGFELINLFNILNEEEQA